MPIFATIYLIVLCLMIVDSLATQARRKERLWILVLGLDLVAASIIIIAFVAYWFAGVARNVGSVLPYVFALAWAWEFCWAPHDIKRAVSELSSEKERTTYLRFGFWVETALVVPAFWFGGRAALRAL